MCQPQRNHIMGRHAPSIRLRMADEKCSKRKQKNLGAYNGVIELRGSFHETSDKAGRKLARRLLPPDSVAG
jgi:hypothetical protein